MDIDQQLSQRAKALDSGFACEMKMASRSGPLPWTLTVIPTELGHRRVCSKLPELKLPDRRNWINPCL